MVGKVCASRHALPEPLVSNDTRHPAAKILGLRYVQASMYRRWQGRDQTAVILAEVAAARRCRKICNKATGEIVSSPVQSNGAKASGGRSLSLWIGDHRGRRRWERAR
jgi:hypothetical protein